MFIMKYVNKGVIIPKYGHRVKILSLKALIKTKRRAGRTKDLLVLPELGALLELQK
jgi:hypothetical protein